MPVKNVWFVCPRKMCRRMVVSSYYGYSRGSGREDRRRCGSLVGHLDQVRNRVQNVGEVIRSGTCYASVVARTTTTTSTLGSFGGRLLSGRVHAYIRSSVGTNGCRAISSLVSALRGLVGWGQGRVHVGCSVAKVDYTTYSTQVRGTISRIPKIGSISIGLLAGSVLTSNSTSDTSVVGTIRCTNCNTSITNRRGGTSGDLTSRLGSARAPGVFGELITSTILLLPLVCISVKRVV